MSNLCHDWKRYYRKCDICGKTWHASEGCCQCVEYAYDYAQSNPCPKCGEVGQVDNKGGWFIECSNCEIETERVDDDSELETVEWEVEEDDTNPPKEQGDE